ncbi:ATP-binding protein [Candidatus Cyanaurora vandensis]|uniref:sensor histidine kinase n=1 Tax=Candidatus Cyanaurora vandensis TaxID=2714958 RepID=UPI00258063E9|nr:ATP-binding protein [Candidatus Cyanaurora vandensis]
MARLRLHLRTQYLLLFTLVAVLPVVVLGVIEWAILQRSLTTGVPETFVGSFALGVGVTVLVAVGFAFWLSERMSLPLQQVSLAMQRLSLGQPTPPLKFAPTALEVQVLVDSFVTMSQRITEQAQANQQLLANLTAEKDKLELIIEAIAEGVLVYGLAGRVITANSAFYELLATNPTDLGNWQGIRLYDAQGERVPLRETIFKRVMAEGLPLRELNRLENHQGQSRMIQTTCAPLKAVTGEILGGVAVIRDVTLQKEGERLREDFVATLTHDLKTPVLAAVQTLNFTLNGQYGALNPQQTRMLQAVVQSHQALLGLIECLLLIYRYEAGRMVLQREPTDLTALVTQCLQELTPLAQARQVALQIETRDPCWTAVDSQQLRRVLVNLIDNALKFTPSGGSVQVQIAQTAQGCLGIIQDTGRGIPPEQLGTLFARFQGSHHPMGTGLGLYLCRQVVEAHGGQIWAKSELGQGSTFCFLLPS